MKKVLAILLMVMLLAGVAFAAEWTEGRSPSKPYLGHPEADFSRSIGYIMRFPNVKVGEKGYCDHLTVYLPREDVTIGRGQVKVYEDGHSGAVASVDFRDAGSVVQRAMTEEELDSLLWGSGVAFDVYLTESLPVGRDYHVTMDSGCICTEDKKLSNPALKGSDAWNFSVTGEYGVQNLYYASYNAERKTTGSKHIQPTAGDRVSFKLVLGGEAKTALLYCADKSVSFDQTMFTESGTYVGSVRANEVNFGVVFLDENLSTVGYVDLSR